MIRHELMQRTDDQPQFRSPVVIQEINSLLTQAPEGVLAIGITTELPDYFACAGQRFVDRGFYSSHQHAGRLPDFAGVFGLRIGGKKNGKALQSGQLPAWHPGFSEPEIENDI